MSGERVLIVGAGLAGSLLGAYLARRGMDVEILERRADLRSADISAGKSINLALSTRGLTALDGVGLADAMKALSLPMPGRILHAPDASISFQPYGLSGQAILSISRRDLNVALMDAAEEAGATLSFGQRCVDVDLDAPSVTVVDASGQERTVGADVVIGADGAFSAVRARMQRTLRFDYQQEFLTHGYKELSMPAAPGGGHLIDAGGLHIWPRHRFMMIALPNLDGTFTCTLFAPFEGPVSFERLKTPEDVTALFQREFPDAVPHMPELVEEFFGNPTGSLVTVRCSPYHRNRVALIGDAAHAVVPFYGQGMNAAFEDCTVLAALLDRHGGDWDKTLSAYSVERKADAHAIADLALYNYLVMRDKVASRGYLLRAAVGRFLHKLAPTSWVPLYSRVTFSDRPYSEARLEAARQDRILDRVAWGVALLLLVAAAALIWALLG
jgi:kynurenine 3-monooxygenase